MKSKSSYQPITRILCSPKHQLAKLVDKVNQLSAFNQCLRATLAPNFESHCRVADFCDKVLTISVDTSAWATRIRYLVPELLPRLRVAHADFAQLKTIRIVMMPAHRARKRSPYPIPSLSSVSAKTIATTARNLPDGPLKEALKRLATR